MSRKPVIPCLLALISGLLGACATQPYTAQPLQPEQTAARFQERSLASAELHDYMIAQGYPEQGFPIRAWGLPELTLAAFYYHPQLAVARAQWQSAQAAEVMAGQKNNPGLSTSAEHHSKTDGGISPWTLGLAIEIPIDTNDKRAIRMAHAAKLSEAARIEIGEVAWRQRSQLRSRWIDYLAATQHIELLNREIALHGDIVQMLQHRLELGAASSIDLGNARLRRLQAQQELSAEAGKLPALKAALAEAAGLPAQALASAILVTAPPPLKTVPDELLQDTALLNRLDLRAALVRYDAAEAKVRLEIARQRPDITLTPGYSFDQGDHRWSLGLSMILAFLNKNEGPIADANAQRQLEARQFDALQIRIIGELAQANARYRSALAEIATAGQVLDAQRDHATRLARQFEAGEIDRLALTEASLETLVMEQDLLAARNRAQQALGLLEDAIQRPLDDTRLPTAPEHPMETPA